MARDPNALVVEHAPDAYALVEGDLADTPVVHVANPALLELCRCRAEQIVGVPDGLFRILPRLDLEAAGISADTTPGTSQRVHTRLEIPDDDGTSPVEVTVEVIGLGSALCLLRIEPSGARPRDDEDITELSALLRSAAESGGLDPRVLRTAEEIATRALRGERQARERAEQAQRVLTHRMHHDPVTGLINRRALTTVLEQAPTSQLVLLVDLDSMKEVNSALGHDVGDRVLREVARRLSHTVNDDCVVGHIGSDEFLVIAPEDHERGALLLARQLIAAVHAPIEAGGQHLQVTASVGIARVTEQRPGEQVLRDVDIAVSRAKADGREQVAWYDHTDHQSTADRVRLTSELEFAISDGQLQLHFQPTFDLRSGTPRSVEALVRWRHPDRGLVPPGQFVPIAEVTGQIDAIGEWCLVAALASAREWLDEADLERVWVNVSPRQIRMSGFADRLEAVLRSCEVAPDRVGIELTESALARDHHATITELERIANHGVQIAIDDFGTGFSGLSRLHQLPVDLLKIDRSFTAGLAERSGATTAAAIIALGHGIGTRVTAEGVEEAEQLTHLDTLGCDLASGFLLAYPVPSDEVLDVCESGSALVREILHLVN